MITGINSEDRLVQATFATLPARESAMKRAWSALSASTVAGISIFRVGTVRFLLPDEY